MQGERQPVAATSLMEGGIIARFTAFSVVVGVFTILGAIAAIAALIYEIVRNRKKK